MSQKVPRRTSSFKEKQERKRQIITNGILKQMQLLSENMVVVSYSLFTDLPEMSICHIRCQLKWSICCLATVSVSRYLMLIAAKYWVLSNSWGKQCCSGLLQLTCPALLSAIWMPLLVPGFLRFGLGWVCVTRWVPFRSLLLKYVPHRILLHFAVWSWGTWAGFLSDEVRLQGVLQECF